MAHCTIIVWTIDLLTLKNILSIMTNSHRRRRRDIAQLNCLVESRRMREQNWRRDFTVGDSRWQSPILESGRRRSCERQLS